MIKWGAPNLFLNVQLGTKMLGLDLASLTGTSAMNSKPFIALKPGVVAKIKWSGILGILFLNQQSAWR